MNKYAIRKKITEKRVAADKILRSVEAGGEIREMTPEESSAFDAVMKDVETLKAQLARMEAVEGDEPAEEKPEARSGRRSAPMDLENREAPEVETRQAAAVHTAKTRKPFSLLRAIRLTADRKPLDGLEGEVGQEMETRTGRHPKGFFLPLGEDPEIRTLMNGGRPIETRDLTTTTGAGAIFTIMETPMIELLRARLVIRKLGATVLTGLQGNFGIPRQNAAASVYWLGEGASASPSTPSLDQVPMTPRVAVALTNISRKLLNQTSVSAEEFVKNDLAETLARESDRVAINGSGTNQPLGILQNSTIQTNSAGLALGANGGAMTFTAAIAMESQVSASNADNSDKMGYLTSPGQRGKLKGITQSSSGYPPFIWTNTPVTGVGEVNGYNAFVSTNVPTNLTKGSASTCSAVIFGNWSDLILAYWDDATDILVNPYYGQAAASVQISMEMSMDVVERHPESFAIITDAL